MALVMGEGNNGAAADAREEEEENNSTGGSGDDEGNEKPNKSMQKRKKKEEGDRSKKASSMAVVLGVDLHCDGCARKVVKAIKAAQGVMGVVTDMAAGTVTVRGKGVVDPWVLKDRVESRTNKQVVFLCPPKPLAPRKKTDDGGKGSGKTTADDDGKKNKEVITLISTPESTVVVKIGLHCNGCIDRIKRTAHKIKGVKQVTLDTVKEHVTVNGTMDAKALPDLLRHKLRREVALVVPASQPAKRLDGGDGDKKKKQQQQGNGGGKKKKIKNKQEEGEAGGFAVPEPEQAFPIGMMYGGGGWSSSSTPYRVEMLHAPQLFSDENPNACAIM